MLAEQVTEGWIPSGDAEKAAVQEQLERLLATPLFNSSKRYPSFLKFVVTRALAGQADQLKERILGVEIFGRATDYDTNTDPIVRVTAAEIRKRIEQYYQDPKHGQQIRLFLPSGSYAPQFSWPGRPLTTTVPSAPQPAPRVSADTSNPATSAKPSESVKAHRRSLGPWLLAIGIATLCIAAVSATYWYSSRPTVLRQFWEPFVKSSEPVLFCMADQRQYSSIRLRDAADPQHELTLNDTMVAIIIDDVSPLANIAGLLRTYGKNHRILGESTTTLTDLRRGPSVFIDRKSVV